MTSSTVDLAQYHKPVSDLFQQPRAPQEWEPYVLSREQLESFRENGFLGGIRVLDDEQVDRLRAELAEIAGPDERGRELFYWYDSNESKNPNTVLLHALGAWRVTPGFHDILWAPAFRMAAYQLLGRPYRQFHDQLFCKPARHGGVVAWHQDFSYWTWTKPMNHLTCWIGLDDATSENGCLYYVPGSHRWGLLPVTGLTGDMEAVREVLSPEQEKDFDNKRPMELKKGHAVFHHPLTMHGSYENFSDRRRRATVINVMGDGVLSNREAVKGREKDLEGFPVPPQDEPMVGTFYPILFDPEKELGSMSVPTL